MGAAAIASLIIVIMLLAVHSHSYARYSNDENILVYEYADGQSTVISNNDSSIQQMISYDDSYVYVDSEAFEDFLEENNAEGEVWIVFGGFYKLPGLTGIAESCIAHPPFHVCKFHFPGIGDGRRRTLCPGA